MRERVCRCLDGAAFGGLLAGEFSRFQIAIGKFPSIPVA
jgi:hypothetical protein